MPQLPPLPPLVPPVDPTRLVAGSACLPIALRYVQPFTMIPMLRRSLFLLTVSLAGFGLAASTLAAHGQDDTTKRGRKYKSPPPTARIEVTIVKDVNGKPIENAAVVFHPMEGEKDKGNMELKTNEDGKTIID